MLNRTARHGYTLVELMVVVAIVGLSIAASVPMISRRTAESRVRGAAYELARIGKRARAETAALGSAHLVWIEPALSRVVLLEAPTSSCNQAWDMLQPGDPRAQCGTAASACTDYLDFTESQFQGGGFESDMMFESADGGGLSTTATAICYTPSGEVWHAQGPALAGLTLSNVNVNPDARGGYRFVFRLLDQGEGTSHGVPRTTVFPLGAAPMVLP